MELSIPLRLLIVAGLFAMAYCQCPSSCLCLSGYVTCPGMTSLPSAFPEDTKSITFSDINIEEFPAGLFEDLFELEQVEVYSGVVGRINKGAFANLEFLDVVSLNSLSIGTIASGAFSNITDMGEIAIFDSSIDTIEGGAFSDLFALDEIKISTSNISKIQSGAFHLIDDVFELIFYSNNIDIMEPYAFLNLTNIYELSMYLNTFDQLGCGSIETLLEVTDEHSFYSNSVPCRCDMLWIKSSPSLFDHYFSNWCQSPEGNENIFWAEMSLQTMECSIDEIQECPPAYLFALLPDMFGDYNADVNNATEHVEYEISTPLDTSNHDQAYLDMTTVQFTDTEWSTYENALPTERTTELESDDISDGTSPDPHNNELVSYTVSESSNVEHQTEGIFTTTSIPASASSKISTTPLSITSTSASLNSKTTPTHSSTFTSTFTSSEITRASMESSSMTASQSTIKVSPTVKKSPKVKQFPTNHDDDDIQLTGNDHNKSDTDVVISDTITEKESNNEETSSYNEDVRGVAYVSEYNNSSGICVLNSFLIICVLAILELF